jgi:hypothetical protein
MNNSKGYCSLNSDWYNTFPTNGFLHKTMINHCSLYAGQ